MINTKLFARHSGTTIELVNVDGDVVATFINLAMFYIVTGYKTVEAYNEWQDKKKVLFLIWKQEH
jgi:hypothetical protein